MPKVAQPGDFFVVGGPVQPDRACYVERSADAELLRGIGEQRFCYVLAARSTGKSSLVARAIRSLRSDGQLAAVVDLSQIAAHGEAGAATRWYYAIAYRVLRELRLRIDLQGWWQEKSALGSEQRLAEFFFEVVLPHTSVPVTVFIDEIERALELPFARALFATIHSCYARRVSDPDYGRLNFVVLGVASPAALCPDTSVSPFIDGVAIEPADFSLEQTRTLAPGFGEDADDPDALLERIHEWSGGQPYLTQRIARGVARKGGRLADIDRVVREQFLAPGAVEKDPFLNRIRLLLTRCGSKQRQALALLGKLSTGAQVPDLPHSPAKELLRLGGVTASDADGQLRYRNKLLREVFGDRWVEDVRPFDWRRAGSLAALVAVAIAVPVWYSQVLPRPYERTLVSSTTDFAAAQVAYEKLSRLPGFARIADRLLADAMAERSRNAETYAEMMAADHVLRRVPEQGPLADALASDYWLRRTREAMHAEQRDDAVLLALEALPAAGAEARRLLAELIGGDYARLHTTLRFASAPVRWAVDWARGEVAIVDRSREARRVGLAGTAGEPVRLTALQHVPIQREIGVEEPGAAGAFRLDVRIRHERPEDLSLVLTAPGGAEARLTLDGRDPAVPSHSFRAADGSPLAALRSADRRGVWRLGVVDGRPGAAGTLLDWSLSFAETPWAWRDAPPQELAIPDPARTGQVEIALSADGTLAAAWPARAGANGSVSVWDVEKRKLLHDLEIDATPALVAFNGDGSRLLVGGDDTLSVWDLGAGRRIAHVAAASGFALPPVPSVDGEFVALAERSDGTASHIELLRVADGALVGGGAVVHDAQAWALGPAARYAAIVEAPPRTVRVIDPRRGGDGQSLDHEHEVRRLVVAPSGDWLLTVDELGDVRAWRIPIDLAQTGVVGGFRLGATADPESVGVSADGAFVAFTAPQGHVVVRDLVEEHAVAHLRIGAADERIETKLSPDGRTLATLQGGQARFWSVEAPEPAATGDANLTALAIDARGAVAALGFRGGHVRVRSASELSRPAPRTDTIDYIGHRGRVTSLDINAPRALIASGGANGLVRVWDLASVAPTKHFMRHPAGPIEAVALSPDGRWLASAGDYFARLWSTDDGSLAGELIVNGTALAVAFAPDSMRWAAGDSAGNVFVARAGTAEPEGSVRAQGPVRAIAFSPDGKLFASGDETGNVEVWDASSFAAVAERRSFTHRVRWIGFAGDGSGLIIQTERWVHRASIEQGRIEVVESRLLPAGIAAGAALASPDGRRIRLVGGIGAGAVQFHEVLLDEPAVAPLLEHSPLLSRDWSRSLGLTIAADGAVVPASH